MSDAELLAILIGSGNTEESAVELMRRLLLSCDNNLNTLAKWEVCDYSRFKGMGPAKSITVMAALELKAVLTDYDMVYQANIHRIRRFTDMFRQCPVRLARLNISGRVIVHHSYLCSPLHQCFPKNGTFS